jgi:GTP-binding protein Era
MNKPPFRCGFVAIVGRPNVGKSTLTNALIGNKISIVSRKAQTTRHRIHGVLTRENEQFIFVDTPGFQTRHGGAMNRMMNRVVTQALADVDVVVHVVEAGKWSPGDAQLPPLLPNPARSILAVNKIDALKSRDELFPYVAGIAAQHEYGAVVPISAAKNRQLDHLLDEIASRLPEGEAMYEADTLTDRPMRFIAAELVREKIFRLVGDELPYGCTVVIEEWEEVDKSVRIAACVIVERDSHRPILLGAGGGHMKRIASEARQDIER